MTGHHKAAFLAAFSLIFVEKRVYEGRDYNS